MMQSCDLPEDDLILYALDDLQGARREYVEAHIANCQECRRLLDRYRHLNNALRKISADFISANEHASARAQMIERARQQQESTQSRSPARRVHRWQVALVTILLLIPIFALLGPEASWANFPLGRSIGIYEAVDRVQYRAFPDVPVPTATVIPPYGSADDPFDLPFVPDAPAELPLELQISEQGVLRENAVETIYQSADGVVIRLTQAPAETSRTRVPVDIDHVEILGTTVLQITGPRDGEASALFWDRGGYVFTLVTMREPSGGLMAIDAHAMVRAIFQAQDDQEKE